MNAVIIGSTGFIGRSLSRELAARHLPSFGIDCLADQHTPANFALCDIARDEPILPDGTDTIFYLAQSPHFRDFPLHADNLFAVNVVGALRAADLARRSGVRAFIYASTGTVYAHTFEPMREDQPFRRDNAYALSKIHAEEALALIPELKTCCVRLFGVFGPGQQRMMVPTIISRIKKSQPVTLEPHPLHPDDHEGLRISLTYVDDVARTLVDLAQHMLNRNDTPLRVNLASDQPTSIRTMAQTIASRLGLSPTFTIAPAPRATDYIADITLMRTICPLRFTPFADAINATLELHA